MDTDEIFTFKKCVPFSEEYDDVFKSMEEQILMYKTEHESLKKEIIKIINENNGLSQKLKEALEIKENNLRNDEEIFNNGIINNLRSQIELISQEKETTYDLWQNALKIIDHLEGELRIYKSSNQKYVNKIELDKEKQKHALEIIELQRKIKSTKNLQEQKNKNIFKDLEFRNNEVQQILQQQEKTFSHIQDKNSKISELKEQLNKMLQTCNYLKEELEKREEEIKKLYIVEQDSIRKVFESVILAETAIVQMEEAIKRESQAKDEVVQLTNSLTELVKEADEKIEKEKEIIKKQYNENLNKLLEEIKSVKKNLNEKDEKLEKVLRENKIFEEEISRIKKGNVVIDDNNISKLLILETNLETSFQKLLLSERRLVQVNAEKESIKMDLNQMAETFERDRLAQNLEKQNLERKISTLQNELSVSNGYVEDYVIQIKELNAKMIQMENEMKNKITKKDKTFEKLLAEKIGKEKQKNVAIQREIEQHLTSEHNLNKRWKNEATDIVDKLQNRISELKVENKKLRNKISNYKKCASV